MRNAAKVLGVMVGVTLGTFARLLDKIACALVRIK